MASRFPQRQDPRSALFQNYNPAPANDKKARLSPTPRGGGGGYGVGNPSSGYAADTSSTNNYNHGESVGYRPATPNRKGQYSDAVLNELESQNDSQVEGILGKVMQLKSMTVAIGDEIRSSSAMAEKMNEGFEGTRLRLKGTMGRMLRMAEKTGVGWKVWLLFFLAVGALFFYVWALR